jgi:hypothetical protein
MLKELSKVEQRAARSPEGSFFSQEASTALAIAA